MRILDLTLAAFAVSSAACAGSGAPRDAAGATTDENGRTGRVESVKSARPAFRLESRFWAAPEQSAFMPVPLKFPRCLRDEGCPFPRAKIPPCSAEVNAASALSVGEALRRSEAGELGAERVLLRGALKTATLMTLLECGERCCNRAGGSYRLIEAREGEQPVVLAVESSGAFRCAGDDSLVCCDFETGDVVAYGVVKGQTLLHPLFCRPADTATGAAR
jgi:hypothetical protein